MKIALCAIAKCENNYIREWVEWYKKLGVNHVFLYDNNDIDGEKFGDVIADYIYSGFVEVIRFRGIQPPCQIRAYQDCYSRNKNLYDWFLFLDIDELLNLYGKSLPEFLSQKKFDGFNGIRVWWKIFDDNGLVTVDDGNYSMYTRFTHPSEHLFDRNGQYQTKTIIRGKLKDIIYKSSVHCPDNIQLVCDPQGNKLDAAQKNKQDYLNWEDAVLNHYMLKTIEEYLSIKKLRGWPNQSKSSSERKLSLDLFFKYNIRTLEKEEFAESFLKSLSIRPEEWPVKNNVDILYIIGTGSRWRNNELKYSLRGLAKNGYNINRVFIVGEIPNFINQQTVVCIPCKDPTNIKHYNMLYKIDKVIQSTDIGKDNDGKFLVSSDDHFYIKPTNFDEYPIYWRGAKLQQKYDKKEKYLISLASTRKVLEEYNLTYYKFNLHRNTWFNTKLWNDPDFVKIRNKSLHVPEGLEPTAIMINYWLSKEPFTPVRCKDCKVNTFVGRRQLLDQIKNSECFSIYDEAIACGVDQYLKELFPDKCKYEK